MRTPYLLLSAALISVSPLACLGPPPVEDGDAGQPLRYDAGLVFDALVVDNGPADGQGSDRATADHGSPDGRAADSARDASTPDRQAADARTADVSSSDRGLTDTASADTRVGVDAALGVDRWAPDAAAQSASQQIAATLAANPGAVDQPIDRAVVTYLRPLVGTAPQGMYLQAEHDGPALFVAFAPGEPSPPPAVGDVVSLRVTQLSVEGGDFVYASAYDSGSYLRHATGFNVASLRQDLSARADLVSSLTAYVGERMAINLTLTGTFGFAGAAHQSALVDSEAIRGSADLKLRLPDSVVTTMQSRLRPGCRVRVDGVVHRYLQQAQPSAWRETDLQPLSCPGPSLVQAGAASAGEIVLVFDQDIKPISAMPGAFTVTPARLVVGSRTNGNEVRLLVEPLSEGQTYTVDVAGTVQNWDGDAIVASARSATVLWRSLHLVINEVDYDQPGTDSHEFVEIKNTGAASLDLSAAGVDLIFYNGSPSNSGVYRRVSLDGAGSLAAGGYLVVASNNVSVVGAGPTLWFSNGDGSYRLDNVIQNATDGPDGLALYHRFSATLLDALSYDGAINAADIDGQTFDLVEGAAATVIDSGSVARSLCRLPDGADSDDAASDWSSCPTPSPGASN